jgi:uncharacterized protein (DUF1697 family)
VKNYSVMRTVSYVALLRGVNVGGKNMLPMKELCGIFGECGCPNARTYIQSGNVIFNAAPKLTTTLPAILAAKIAARFGFQCPVVFRTEAQLQDVILNNPFLKQGAPENSLHVCFLADEPQDIDIQKLDPARSLPDEFHVRKQEIYLRLPNGGARTKLTNSYFDSKLHTISTARNWRTVLKLLELLQQDLGKNQ